MTDIVPFDRDEIIKENEKVIEDRFVADPQGLEFFHVDLDRLDDVFTTVNSVDNNLSREDRVITMAAHFLGAMSWAQPFVSGNKQTAILMAIVFMRDNGFDLNIPAYDETALMDLLYEVQLDRSSPDGAIMRSLFLYTKSRTIHYG